MRKKKDKERTHKRLKRLNRIKYIIYNNKETNKCTIQYKY